MDEIVWTRRARRNLDEIGAYIAEDDAAAAERTVRRIVERVSVLNFFPRSGWRYCVFVTAHNVGHKRFDGAMRRRQPRMAPSRVR